MRSQSSVPATKARPRGCPNSSRPRAKIGARAAAPAAAAVMSRPDNCVRDHLLTETVRQISRSWDINTRACSAAGPKRATAKRNGKAHRCLRVRVSRNIAGRSLNAARACVVTPPHDCKSQRVFHGSSERSRVENQRRRAGDAPEFRVDFGRQSKLRSISSSQDVRIRRWAPLHAQLRPQPHLSQLRRSHHGALMPKPNYHQARKQKELARKARQQEKQQRRSARPDDPGATPPAGVDALRESTPETAK